jgi:hypothetical protein
MRRNTTTNGTTAERPEHSAAFLPAELFLEFAPEEITALEAIFTQYAKLQGHKCIALEVCIRYDRAVTTLLLAYVCTQYV